MVGSSPRCGRLCSNEAITSICIVTEANERMRFILLADSEWNESNDLCTHSLKINRRNVEAAYSSLIADLCPGIERIGS